MCALTPPRRQTGLHREGGKRIYTAKAANGFTPRRRQTVLHREGGTYTAKANGALYAALYSNREGGERIYTAKANSALYAALCCHREGGGIVDAKGHGCLLVSCPADTHTHTHARTHTHTHTHI